MSAFGSTQRNTEQETRQQQLLELGRLLLEQARAEQWDSVRLTDGRLAQFIAHMSKQPALWSALKPAREQVRGWHQEALLLCQQAAAESKLEWQTLSQQREGLQAYEETQEWA